ncbi:phosphate/phosphite/phosphonate ABC transporter substrate-binding protein [Limnohabitans sp.]|uniref:phosphate/phosphite/phosphonate ABC transporter substrate-binding protein n=1 Tax=Limnohabitans sp. TaxID=1907725 RepID=UPI00286F3146|nr:phosphate/phosphite/phosphonate ABC transporter substrate-binding protein [Limnohabitans sp.]
MRTVRQHLLGIFASALLISGAVQAACLGDPHSTKVYSFDVVPQLTAAKIYTTWSPLLQRVGQEAGLCFELRVWPTIPEFEQKLLKGDPEFVFLNPYHAVLAYQKKKYQPLLADSEDLLTGILVVRTDSPIQSLEALKGKTVSLPAPNAFAASLLIRAELAKRKIDVQPVFVKTHSNVYRSVIGKDAVAGGGVNNTLDNEASEVRQQLRVLFETPAYTPHPIVTHPSVPAAVRERFLQAMLKLTQDDAGRKLLDDINLHKPQAVTYAKHYKPLEALQLEKLLVLSGQ